MVKFRTKKKIINVPNLMKGFPHPENIALSQHLEELVRDNGGVPATIGVLNGIAKVGFEAKELKRLLQPSSHKKPIKISRRDLAYICGLGINGHKINGGTTVSGTMVLAHLAGIKVFATGGLGGVHRGGENSMDISADLTELGRTPIAVICSGCKSFLDIPRTLEYLETQGVCVGTFADGRTGEIDFPAFWTRDSTFTSPKIVHDEKEAASMIHAQNELSIMSGLLFANPIPQQYSLPKSKMDSVIAEAVDIARQSGRTGSDNTPFILSKIRELTKGATVVSNEALVMSNVERGTKVAVELARLELEGRGLLDRMDSHASRSPSGSLVSKLDFASSRTSMGRSAIAKHVAVVVAGSLNIDISCDFNPDVSTLEASQDPYLYTSNPAIISQSLGGVGQNIATALHYLGTAMKFCSAVGNDSSGKTAIDMLADRGLNIDGVEVLTDGSRSSQYIAFNNGNNELTMAMADVRILENENLEFDKVWRHRLERSEPKWVVIDANWDPVSLRRWTEAARSIGAKIAYEPVSVGKSCRILEPNAELGERLMPLADLATPNKTELSALFYYVNQHGERWGVWRIFLNSLDTNDRLGTARHEVASSLKEADMPLVIQSLHLLPYFPCILTKVDSQGVLLIELLREGDPRLSAPEAQQYVFYNDAGPTGNLQTALSAIRKTLLSQELNKQERVEVEKDCAYLDQYRGIYMRLFPPAEIVPQKDIVSVNGVGDTFLGVLMAGLAKENPKTIDELVMVAQQASVLTLKSKESVSPDIESLKSLL